MVVCSSQSGFQKEQDHNRQAFLRCNYPTCTLNRLQNKINHKSSSNQAHVTGSRHLTNNDNNHSIFLVVPYTSGLRKNFKKVCNKVWSTSSFQRNNIICNLLVAPKDKDTIMLNSGVIYQVKCIQANCHEEYIGESRRPLWTGLRKSLGPSPPFTNIFILQGILFWINVSWLNVLWHGVY